MPNALLRILTALLGVPALLGLAYLGGWPFAALVAVMAVGAQHEVYRMLATGGVPSFPKAGLALGVLVALQPVWPGATALLWTGGLALLAWATFTGGDDAFRRLAATLFGLVYPVALFAFLTRLRSGDGLSFSNEEALLLTVTVFLLVWATDVMAYFAGKTFGRHKLAPSISPNKTWEGSIGGALGALAVAIGLKLSILAFLAWPHAIVMAILCGAVAQVGDLAESRLKRSVGVKDSGSLLPGHGGLLDRFDALIMAVPLVYLYFRFIAPFWAG